VGGGRWEIVAAEGLPKDSWQVALLLELECARTGGDLLGGGECEDAEAYKWLKSSLLVDALGNRQNDHGHGSSWL